MHGFFPMTIKKITGSRRDVESAENENKEEKLKKQYENQSYVKATLFKIRART